MWQSFLVDVALKSFVVMLVVAILASLCGRLSAAIRHRMWTLGIVSVLLLPWFSALLPTFQLALLPVQEGSHPDSIIQTAFVQGNSTIGVSGQEVPNQPRLKNTASALNTSVNRSPSRSNLSDHRADQIGWDSSVMASDPGRSGFGSGWTEPAEFNSVVSSETTDSNLWMSWLMGAWALGTFTLIVPWLFRSLRTRCWIASGVAVSRPKVTSLHEHICCSLAVRGPVPLLRCSDLAMPCAAGWFRPVVMLPDSAMDWPTERLRPVLLHELAHVLRRDLLIQSLAEVGRACYWFNPLVWLAVSRLRLERERACDDHVLQSGFAATDYAQVLLDVAKDYRRSQRSVGLAMARPKDLACRLQSLLDQTRSHIPLSRSASIGMLVVVMSVSGMTSALRLVARAQEDSAERSFEVLGGDKEGLDWIEGTGASLRMRVRGHVVDSLGQPVTEPEVEVALKVGSESIDIQPAIRGNAFEVWVPANGSNWQGINIQCSQGNLLSSQFYRRHELRQIAVNPLRFELHSPDRSVSIHVTHEGAPVANAKVKAILSDARIAKAKTDERGVVNIDLYGEEQLRTLTAWTIGESENAVNAATNDLLIGGYQFHQQPIRDRDAAVQTIEMFRCREQRVRIVDEEGEPVQGVRFQMQIATPQPYFNYLGIVDDQILTTNASGEGIVRWYPDWPEVHSYVELIGDRWSLSQKGQWVSETLQVAVKPRAKRERVRGRVTPGPLPIDQARLTGISVYAFSYQGDEESRIESQRAFTDRDGQFWIDSLPGSTYSIFVDSPDLVSRHTDVVLFDSATNQANSPTVVLQQGVLVTVKLTSGPNRLPIVNEIVRFHSDHSFEFVKDDRQTTGRASRDLAVVTGDDGVATALFPEGMVEVAVMQSDWQTTRTIEVTGGGDNSITIHRDIVEGHEVVGGVVMSKGDLEDPFYQGRQCTLAMGSLDGKARDIKTIKTDAGGRFAFSTVASKLGILAITEDQKYSGHVITKSLTDPIEIVLRPTQSYTATLVDVDGNVIANRNVAARIQMKDIQEVEKVSARGRIDYPSSFLAFNKRGETNDKGEVTFSGLPTRLPISFYSEGQEWPVGDAYLEPGEQRKRATWKFERVDAKKSVATTSNIERWENTLRNGQLGGYHSLLVVQNNSNEVERFVSDYLTRARKMPIAARFMTMTYDTGTGDAEFESKLSVKKPSDGAVTVIAYNLAGSEVDRITFVVNDANSVKHLDKFLNANAPATMNVQEAWDQAFALAKRTDRRVWVRIGGRYCAPCYTLSRLLDEHSQSLSQDFVMLKLDDADRTSQPEIFDRLLQQAWPGIPFHVIFDANGKRLIDSNGPMGNIGSPSSFEGVKHFSRMLEVGRRRMTDKEINALISSIERS
ncbi:M56 family metallopeptidase [Rubripirellula amarantea]